MVRKRVAVTPKRRRIAPIPPWWSPTRVGRVAWETVTRGKSGRPLKLDATRVRGAKLASGRREYATKSSRFMARGRRSYLDI